MSDKATANASVSTGFSWLGLLGVILVAAKIADSAGYENVVGDWSWWLVLLPFYIGLVFLLVIGLGFGIFFLFAHIMEQRDKRKWKKRQAERRAQVGICRR